VSVEGKRPRRVRIAAAERSEIGLVRERNEDAAHTDPDRRFFVVADGMGGRNGGDEAAALAIEVVCQQLERAREELAALAAVPSAPARALIEALLEQAIHAANRAVRERSQQSASKRGMGTTLEVLVVVGREAFIAHVGDSRTYVLRKGVAYRATVDHTVAQAMLSSGAMGAEEAERSPLRSALCNAIGPDPRVVVDQIHVELEPGDRILLCTDGLYDEIDGAELAQGIAAGSPGEALDHLIDEALRRGGHDNVTGILIEVAAAPATTRTLPGLGPRMRAPATAGTAARRCP